MNVKSLTIPAALAIALATVSQAAATPNPAGPRWVRNDVLMQAQSTRGFSIWGPQTGPVVTSPRG